MNVLRSLLFYLAFYTGSVFYVLGSVLTAAVAPRHARFVPDAWSRFTRGARGGR